MQEKPLPTAKLLLLSLLMLLLLLNVFVYGTISSDAWISIDFPSTKNDDSEKKHLSFRQNFENTKIMRLEKYWFSFESNFYNCDDY